MQFIPPDSQYDINDAYYMTMENMPMTFDVPDTNVCSTLMNGMYRCNPVKTVRFDPFEEILWSISCFGNLCGYHDLNMNMIISVEVPHLTKEHQEIPYELLDLLVSPRIDQRLLYLLNSHEIVIYTKMGVLVDRISDPKWFNQNNSLSSFCHHPYDSNQLFIGTEIGDIIQYDIEHQREVCVYRLPNSDGKGIEKGVAVQRLLNNNRGGILGCFMNGGGTVASFDLKSRKTVCQFTPHLESLTDFTVNMQGHAVVSCGSHIQHGHEIPDPYLQVYDLRYKKAQCPIRTETKPAFVRFMPVFNDSMLISTISGFYQVANFGHNCLVPPLYQAHLLDNYDYVQCLDIASSGSLLAFGTSGGMVSLSTASKAPDPLDNSNNSNNHPPIHRINTNSQVTPLPVIPSYMELEPVKFDDPNFVISSSQFSTQPINKDKFTKLSSDWPEHLSNKKFAHMKPVDLTLFKDYQSKFKKELIGTKPPNWGPVWFPY